MGFQIAFPIPTFPTYFLESSPQHRPLGSGILHPVFHRHPAKQRYLMISLLLVPRETLFTRLARRFLIAA